MSFLYALSKVLNPVLMFRMKFKSGCWLCIEWMGRIVEANSNTGKRVQVCKKRESSFGE